MSNQPEHPRVVDASAASTIAPHTAALRRLVEANEDLRDRLSIYEREHRTVRLEQLRADADNPDNDLFDDIEDGRWETDVDPDPVITVELRLRKSLLDRLRNRADADEIAYWELVLRWIRDGLGEG